MPSLDLLAGFEAAARHLSFTKAAEELFLTQSAVSRQIKGLEDELGAPLFTRGTRHVELTGSGSALRFKGGARDGAEVTCPSCGTRLVYRKPTGAAAPAEQGGRTHF